MRRYGAGSVFPHQGQWIAQWELPKQDGKRRRRQLTAETEALGWKRMRAAQAAEGRSSSRSRRPTESVGSFLDRWLRDVVQRTRRERTAVGYRAIVMAVVRDMPELDMGDPALPHELQAYLNGLDLHPRTVQHYAACLRTAFAYAVRKGLMERNPAADLDLPAIPRTDRIPLTADELRSFLAQAKGEPDDGRSEEPVDPRLRGADAGGDGAGLAAGSGDQVGGERSRRTTTGREPVLRHAGTDPLYALWVTAAWTGLRSGELLALRWEDVSLERASLVVRKSLTRLPGPNGTRYVLSEPKTDRSRREVPLLSQVVDALRPLRKEYLRAKPRLDQGLVFATAEGSPLDATRVYREFQAALDRTGTRRVRLHDLRHTAATLMIQSGMDLATVSGILGHSTITTTVDIYSHVTAAHRTEAMRRFGESVG